MAFEERDVTGNPRYMDELKKLMGRFVTPTIVINGQAFLGFGANLSAIRALVRSQQDPEETDHSPDARCGGRPAQA